MARPTKQGLDYFPMDVHMDNKIKFIEIKFGLEGFAAVVKMFQEIYAGGYWIEWGEDEQLLFAGEHKIDPNKLQEITKEAVKREIFNPVLFEKYGILTSKGIQSRYKEIVRRRKDVVMISEYTLIDGSFGINAVINSINGDTLTAESQHDDGESTQSKVNKSKVNNNTGSADDEPLKNEEQKPAADPNDLKSVFNFYENNFGVLGPFIAEELGKWFDDFNERGEIVIAALKVALENKAQWAYAKTILNGWINSNVKTIEDARAAQKEYANKLKGKGDKVTAGSKYREFE